MPHSLIYRDIAMVFAAAFICGMIAWRLRQPILLGYVLAGLILSPLTPGPRVHDVHIFETMAEIGVILLMFSVGIEFSIPELLKVKWVALLGAPLGICLSVGIGVGAGSLLGWPLLQGIAVGCIISVASTMVMMRLLMDRGELSAEAGRVMITLTLVEDLAVVVLTILLPSLNAAGASYGEVAWKIGRALLLLIPIVFAGWKIVPRLLLRIERTCNDEISLLLALTICLVVAALTEFIGLSLALGAFVAGLILGNSTFVHKLEKQTLPLRDAFVALFFVTIGMLIDPSTWLSSWQLVLVLVGDDYYRKIWHLVRRYSPFRLLLGHRKTRGHRTDANWRILVHPRASLSHGRTHLPRHLQRHPRRVTRHHSRQRHFLQVPLARPRCLSPSQNLRVSDQPFEIRNHTKNFSSRAQSPIYP